jgi:hypothetical protein
MMPPRDLRRAHRDVLRLRVPVRADPRDDRVLVQRSRLVTVWDAANSPTLKWYAALFRNEQILEAAWLSIRSPP